MHFQIDLYDENVSVAFNIPVGVIGLSYICLL